MATVSEYFVIEPNWDEKISFKKKWNTSFQTSINNKEKRSALFTWPRRTLEFSVDVLSYAHSSYLNRIIYKNLNNVWGVPFWMDASPLTSQAASSQKNLNLSTLDRNFEVGAEVMLYNSYDSYEVGVIASKTDSSITLVDNLVNTWAEGITVYPVLKARVRKSQTFQYNTDQTATIKISAAEEYDEITRYTPSIASFETYKGYPVFNVAPDWSMPIEEGITHNYELLQWLGKSQVWSQWTESQARYKAEFFGPDKDTISKIINFFDYNQGRWGAFWRPSWISDVKLAATVAASDYIINVKDIEYDDWKDTDAGSHLIFIWPDNSFVIRKIKNVISPSYIQLVSPIGKEITEDDLSNFLVSFAILSIFNQDEIEVEYFNDSVADFSLNFRSATADEQPEYSTTTTTSTSTTSSSSSTSSSTTSTTSTTVTSTGTVTTTTVWLGTWAKRRELIVDNTNIDSDLTHFPIPIVLGTSVGQSSQDISDIFDELGTNSKKIAITKDDGTQIYGEIEVWDAVGEKAVIHVSKSDLVIDSATTTTLYIYFDSSQPDNTTYIGDTTDSPAQEVWDSDFAGVYHMAQDPSGGSGAIKDSTSNANHGTSAGSMTSGDLVDGLIGKGLDLDGINDYIDLGDTTVMDGATAITLEAVANFSALSLDAAILRKWTAGNQAFSLGSGASVGQDDELQLSINDSTGTNILAAATTAANIATSTDYVLAGVWPGSNTLILYKDGSSTAISYSQTNTPSSIPDVSERLAIGARYNLGTPDKFSAGIFSEIRFSIINRSAAWLKATNYGLRDNLLTFGSIEHNWLGTWAKRKKIVVDNTNIDSDLTHFPIPIVLGTSVGQSSQDVSDIFDELSGQSVDDSFTGIDTDPPNEDLWEIVNNSAVGTAEINSNKLRVSIPITANDENILVNSTFKLSGDFDIQIDYDEISNDQPSSSYSYPARLRIDTDDGNRFYIGTFFSSGGDHQMVTNSTADGSTTTTSDLVTSGKFRLVRSGSTITSYYWDSTQWEWNGNTSGNVFSDSDSSNVVVELSVVADFDSGATTDYDNFTVNSGTIVWSDINTNPDRKKIAITKEDGTTQLYGEIEIWDSVNEKAVIHVSKSDLVINNATTTTLYIYFDSTQPDNTTYIGDTTDSPAQNVWDGNFKGVYHMAQDPSGGAGAIKDSTSNANHGTSAGSMTSGDLVDADVGKAIAFDGTDDYINFGDVFFRDYDEPFTCEISYKWSVIPTAFSFLMGKADFANDEGWSFRNGATGYRDCSYMHMRSGGTDIISIRSTNPAFVDTNFHVHAGLYDGSANISGLSLFLDGSELAVTTVFDLGTLSTFSNSVNATLSARQNLAGFCNNIVAEARFSIIERSAAWLKATNYGLKDNLLTFGSTQNY